MNASENRTDEIADLLTAGVPEIFETMLGMDMFPTSPNAPSPDPAPAISAAVGFTGEVNGMVHLRVKPDFARSMAAKFLSLPEEELTPEMVDDTIGEVGNMVVGAVKSRLCDEGSPCVLTIPVVAHEEAAPAVVSGEALLSFRGSQGSMTLELRMADPA